MNKRMVPLLLLVSVLALMVIGLGAKQKVPAPAFPMQGQLLPSFSLQDLESQRPVTEQSLLGQIAVINIWASWCRYCRAEHDFWMAMSEKNDVPLIGVNYRDQRHDALRYLNQAGDPYQFTIADPKGKLGLLLGSQVTPETYLVDEQGVLLLRFSGPMTAQRWEALFEPAILAARDKVPEHQYWEVKGD